MQGLTEKEAAQRLVQWGTNDLHLNETKRLFRILRDTVLEPMFILLAVASLLYFLLGETPEGLMMVTALCFVAAISLYQEVRSASALAALQALTQPLATVIREAQEKQLPVEQVVPGDILLIAEGETIAADAVVLQSNDLKVAEAILTGESYAVEKDAETNNKIFQGTVVSSGRCLARVTATGKQTALGKIGKSIATYSAAKTPLQKQVGRFVRWMALFGVVAFLLIFGLNYANTHEVAVSLLFGLTIAMSAIPEEIPVAFSSFMALGAHTMAQLGIITRQPQTVENLGAVNVICLDKTGTITANKMAVATVHHFRSGNTATLNQPDDSIREVLFIALLASEQQPFDAMEQAIAEAYNQIDSPLSFLPLAKEYPLEGKPPMMTHVYAKEDHYLATAKGGVEHVLAVCHLTEEEKSRLLQLAGSLAKKGQRVLGVARAVFTGSRFPEKQDDFDWQFVGLLSLNDPPKPAVKGVLQELAGAGILVKLLTGDYTETAVAVAAEIGLPTGSRPYTGDEVMAASDAELAVMVSDSNLFARMYPDAKMRVIKTLKKEGHIVAMTGDGVNDAPALKAASIGITLGKTGTAVAQQAADLILTDDDLQKLPQAVQQGRKIYSNFTRAVRYIISIHLPIILVASLPVVFAWRYPNIFTPIHVIFLELIMGPTCSIFFEREPVTGLVMKQPPRAQGSGLFTRKEGLVSVVQGLAIALGVLLLYHLYSAAGASLREVRTIVFSTLILSNIFLTFANRSFEEPITQTIRYKNNLALPVFLSSVLFLFMLHSIPFVQNLFGLAPISLTAFFACLLTAVLSVGWFEVYKIGLKAA